MKHPRKIRILVLTTLMLTAFQNCGEFESTSYVTKNASQAAPGAPSSGTSFTPPVIPGTPAAGTGSTRPPTATPAMPTAPAPAPAPSYTSRLVFTRGSARSFPDCFPSLGRGDIRHEEIIYKEITDAGRTIRLKAYVHYPPGFSSSSGYRLPAVAFFHGGGFAYGSPVFWMPGANYFAARGMVTVTFQYRLIGMHYAQTAKGHEASVADARSAMRWLRKNAASLGINANKIAAAGDSAGGHLAFATSFLNTINDETGADLAISPGAQLLIGAYPALDPQPLSITQALPQTTNVPPIFILHGTADAHPWTQYSASTNFCDTVNRRGGSCSVSPYSGRNHDFLSTLIMDTAGNVTRVGTDGALSLAQMDYHLIRNGFTTGDENSLMNWANTAPAHCKMMDYSSQPLQSWWSGMGYTRDGNLPPVPRAIW